MSDNVTVVPPMDGMGFGGNSGIWGVLLGALLGGSGLFGRGGYGYGGPAAGAVATEAVINPTLNAIQNQITSLGNEINNHEIEDVINSFRTDASANWAAINANINGVTRDLSNSVANLSTAVASGNFTTLNSINGLGRDITAQNTQALINNLQNFNTLTGTITSGNNQIIGTLNDMRADQAQCCCELKNAIAADGAATRALINDLNVQNLRDQLSAANNKVSNFEQNQYLVSTIVGHLKPPVVV